MDKIKINEAHAILVDARGCIECIFLATEGLGLGQQARAIQCVASIANDKLDEALALLNEYLKAPIAMGEPHDHA